MGSTQSFYAMIRLPLLLLTISILPAQVFAGDKAHWLEIRNGRQVIVEYEDEATSALAEKSQASPRLMTLGSGSTYEPNNASDQATSITVDQVRRLACPHGVTAIDPTESGASNPDIDWYVFNAAAGDVFFAYLDAERFGSALSANLELLDSTLNVLATGENTNQNKQIKFYTIPASGRYYLRVSGIGASTGVYKLYANKMPPEIGFYRTGIGQVARLAYACGGTYFYATCGGYERLSLYESAGSGTPVYSLTGVPDYFKFDAAEDSTLAIGLHLDASYSDDTWSWDGAAWTRMTPPVSPRPTAQAAMAFDAARSEVVMFGGHRFDQSRCDDTWTWNGTTWTKKNPATVPTASDACSMIYDSQRGRIVLYLMDATYNVPETWEWDGTNWAKKNTAHLPPAGYAFAFAFDSARNVGVLFGPGNATTWEYNGTDWTQRAPATNPTYTAYQKTMAFNPDTGLCMLVTAENPCETWTWDGTNWTKLTTSAIAMFYKNLVYDTDRHRFVLTCKDSYATPSIIRPDPMPIYEWNGSDWELIATAAAPENRELMATAYDAARHRTVLFGGYRKYLIVPIDIDRFQTPSSTVTTTTHTANTTVATGVRITPDGSRAFTSQFQWIDVEDGAGLLIKRIYRAIAPQIRDTTDDGSIISFKEGGYGIVYDVNRDKELFRNQYDVPELDGDGSRMVTISGKKLVGYDRVGDTYRQIWSIPFNNEFSLCNISADGSLVAATTQIGFSFSANLGMVDYLLNGATGEVYVEYNFPRDPATNMQNGGPEIAINRNGTLAAFADWGGDRSQPEFVVFSPKQGVPLLQLATPGSGMSIALKNNLLVMGTKSIHANIFGGGGEIYFADLSSVVANTAPMVRNVTATPAASLPASSVTITAKVTDENGVGGGVATITSVDDTIATVTLHDDGLSGDGAAGDSVYGGALTTDATPRDYSVSIRAADSLGKQAFYPDQTAFTTNPAPHVDVAAVTFSDAPFDDDIEWFAITLTNNGTTTAPAVTVKLEAKSPWIQSFSYMKGSPTLIGDLAAGQSRSSGAQDFMVFVNTAAPIDTIMPVGVVLTDSAGHTWNTTINLPPWAGAFAVNGSISTRTPLIDEQVTFTSTVINPPGAMREVNALVKDGDTGALLHTVPMFDDGLHNDCAAGDSVYGATWTTPHTPGFYTLSFQAIAMSGASTSWNATSFRTMAPFVAHHRVLVINGGLVINESYAQAFANALTRLGVAFDVWEGPFHGPTPQSVLDHYLDGAVIYELGWGGQPADAQLSALQTYLDRGGNLIFSAMDSFNASMSTSVLFNSYLEAADVLPANVTQLAGNSSDPIGSGLTITTSNSNHAFYYQLGILAHPCFDYVSSTHAGIWRVDTWYKAIAMGFPFAEITTTTAQDELLARMLNHFDPSLLPATGFTWNVPAGDLMQGLPINVSLTAINRCAGTVTNFSGAVSLEAWTTVQIPMTPGTAGTFVGGSWNGTVTIPEAANGIHLVANGTGATGQSSTFNVVALSSVWVDFGFAGTELGTNLQPFNTLAEGAATVQSGNTVNIKPGTSSETLRITRPMRLTAPSGQVRIGAGH